MNESLAMATTNSPSVTNTTVVTRDNRPRVLFLTFASSHQRKHAFHRPQNPRSSVKNDSPEEAPQPTGNSSVNLWAGRAMDRPADHTRKTKKQQLLQQQYRWKHVSPMTQRARNGKVATLFPATLPLRWWPVGPESVSRMARCELREEERKA